MPGSRQTPRPQPLRIAIALFSLVYREALRNGKVTSNPARSFRQRREDNIIIRWLRVEEVVKPPEWVPGAERREMWPRPPNSSTIAKKAFG